MTDNVENKLPGAEMPLGVEAAPEAGRETAARVENGPAKEQMAEAAAPAPVPVAAPAPPAVPPAVDPTVSSIEFILSEDLADHFRAMPPDVQARFRAKGDETVSKLAILVSRTVIKAKEVLNLIVAWLRLIPGVNKYFLEQESKIKTDKILELHKRQHGE